MQAVCASTAAGIDNNNTNPKTIRSVLIVVMRDIYHERRTNQVPASFHR
jgi:hypothetical protein